METLKDILKTTVTQKKPSGVTREWKEKAIRDMKYLGIELKEADVSRVYKVYKNEAEGKPYKTNTARVVSYLKDYPRPLNYEAKLKMFFKFMNAGFTNYRSVNDLSEQQSEVMKFIIEWAKNNKRPVSNAEVVKNMKELGMKADVIKWSLSVLLAKGYIRRGWTEKYNTTVYVQLRNL